MKISIKLFWETLLRVILGNFVNFESNTADKTDFKNYKILFKTWKKIYFLLTVLVGQAVKIIET
jgi:hypothetical protein